MTSGSASIRAMTRRERVLLYPGMLVCLASMLVYLFVNYRHFINSDSASVVLLAEDIVRSGQWMPSTWQYVSDGIPVLSNAHLAVPFVAVLGPSVLAHALTAACGAALMLFGLFQLGRATSLDPEWSFLGATVVLSGTSMIYADLLLGQMVSVELAKLGLFIAALLRLAQGRNVSVNLGLVCVLLAIQFTASPRKAFAFFLFPALVALILQALAPWGRDALLRCNPRAVLALLVATLVGAAAHQWLAGQLSVNTQYASFVPAAGTARVGNNLLMFWELAFKFLDLSGDGPALPNWAQLISHQSRVASTATFIAGAGLCAWHATHERNQSLLLLTAFVIASAVTILGALLLGSGIKPHYGIYYLVYAGAPAVFLVFHGLLRVAPQLRLSAIALALLPALLLSAKNSILADPAKGVGYSGPSERQTTDNKDKQRLIDWLHTRRLDRGYALFWDANAMTVLSGGRIRVAPLRKRIEPFMWLTSTALLEDVRRSPDVFVAIPLATTDAPAPADCLGSSTHLVGAYRVHILDHDAASCTALRRPAALFQ